MSFHRKDVGSHDRLRRDNAAVLPRSPATTADIPVLVAEHFTLGPATGVTKPYGPGFFRGLEAVLAQPWSPSNVVLRDAMATVSMGMASLESLAQSQTSRKRAYESYSRTVSGLRAHLTAPSSTQAPLAAAILLLAMYELAVECSQHKTAWRQHVSGLQGIVYQPGGDVKCSIRRMSALSHTMWSLRTLAPTLDAIFRGDLQPRELDVRTLRVHVRKLHKDLLVFRSVQEREAQLTLGDDVHASTEWLGVHASLLLTARFLDASGGYLHRRDRATWCSSSEYRKLEALRHDLVRHIVDETTTQLVDRAETPFDCQSRDLTCLSDEMRVRPLKTVETLLMLLPLTVAICEAGSSSAEHTKLCTLLDTIGNACLFPKAASIMARVEEKEQLEYSELLDGLLVLSSAVDMDFKSLMSQ